MQPVDIKPFSNSTTPVAVLQYQPCFYTASKCRSKKEGQPGTDLLIDLGKATATQEPIEHIAAKTQAYFSKAGWFELVSAITPSIMGVADGYLHMLGLNTVADGIVARSKAAMCLSPDAGADEVQGAVGKLFGDPHGAEIEHMLQAVRCSALMTGAVQTKAFSEHIRSALQRGDLDPATTSVKFYRNVIRILSGGHAIRAEHMEFAELGGRTEHTHRQLQQVLRPSYTNAFIENVSSHAENAPDDLFTILNDIGSKGYPSGHWRPYPVVRHAGAARSTPPQAGASIGPVHRSGNSGAVQMQVIEIDSDDESLDLAEAHTAAQSSLPTAQHSSPARSDIGNKRSRKSSECGHENGSAGKRARTVPSGQSAKCPEQAGGTQVDKSH